MDVHAFINSLKEDGKNNKLLQNIKESIMTEKSIACEELILETPPSPEDFRLKLRAKCIHGNIFEDKVLKSTLDNYNRNFSVVGSNNDEAQKKAIRNFQDFQEIFGKKPSKNYTKAMETAGMKAWSILKSKSTGNTKLNRKTIFAYEEWVPNSVSENLMKSLRADCVGRTGDFTLVVDLKFSTMSQKSYEDKYLIDGIIQVLLYAALMDLDPDNHTTGVLVYYGKEGEIVFYSTDKFTDLSCMEKLYKEAGIPLKLLKGRRGKETRKGQVVTKELRDVAQTSRTSRKEQQVESADTSRAEFSDAEIDLSSDLALRYQDSKVICRDGQYLNVRVNIKLLELCFCLVGLFIAIFVIWREHP